MIVFLGGSLAKSPCNKFKLQFAVRCQGLLNNGEGCLTTHLSDIGLFIDGRPVNVLEAGDSVWTVNPSVPNLQNSGTEKSLRPGRETGSQS